VNLRCQRAHARRFRSILLPSRWLSRSARVSPIHIADAYLGFGDCDRALDLLGQAYDDRNAALMWVTCLPFYDVIRDDPRFKALVARLRPGWLGDGLLEMGGVECYFKVASQISPSSRAR
jgi:hypothetical protein